MRVAGVSCRNVKTYGLDYSFWLRDCRWSRNVTKSIAVTAIDFAVKEWGLGQSVNAAGSLVPKVEEGNRSKAAKVDDLRWF